MKYTNEVMEAREIIRSLILSDTALYKHQALHLYKKAELEIPEHLRSAPVSEKILADGRRLFS